MSERGQTKAIVPQKGERALIVGQTGSGKTAFACWLLKRIEQSPIIIYDTKEETKFQALPHSVVVSDHAGVNKAIEDGEADYIVFRPAIHITSSPDALDDLLYFHYNNYRGIPVYIDELYTFHKNGQALPGLIALLTRGRSRGITTIMSSQRPAWISRFCITEAQRFYIFRIKDKRDAKVFDAVIEDFSKVPKAPPHYFYYEKDGDENLELFEPVKLDDGIDKGYIDTPAQETGVAEEQYGSIRLRNAHWL